MAFCLHTGRMVPKTDRIENTKRIPPAVRPLARRYRAISGRRNVLLRPTENVSGPSGRLPIAFRFIWIGFLDHTPSLCMARRGVEALQKGMLSGRRLIVSHTMTATDPAERSFADLHHWGSVPAHPEFLGGSRCSPHLSAATERTRYTLRNVASTVGTILATHSASYGFCQASPQGSSNTFAYSPDSAG